MNKRPVIPPEHVGFLRAIVPVGDVVVDVMEVAGVPPLTKEQRHGFDCLHAYLFSPQPDWLTKLRANPKSERWYKRFVGGIYDGVQSARLAAGYHLENVVSLEAQVDRVLTGRDLSSIPANSVVAVGGTQKFEFEYHSYILAYRRVLEYMARAIAGYFRSDCNSFRDLPKVLDREAARIASTSVRAVYEKYRPKFSFVVSEGGQHVSLRDLLCHYEFLGAGVYNLTASGFKFCGGAELLGQNGASHRLSEVLTSKIDLLDSFITEMLCELTDAIRKENPVLQS